MAYLKIFFKKYFRQNGFTLLEMLVVLTVVSIMVSISMFHFRKLNQRGAIESSSYDLALFFRQGQAFGISSSDFDPTFGSPEDVQPVGINFDHSGSNYSPVVELFRDVNKDNSFTNNQDVLLEKFLIRSGIFIQAICPANSQNCVSDDFGNDVTILFQRPEPAPFIFIDNNPYSDSIAINLTDTNNDSNLYIIIEPSGNIRVSKET